MDSSHLGNMKVSVLMSVYNENPDFVTKAIRSILEQTLSEFEFLIYNDNPNDVVLDGLISSFQVSDSRIRYFRNDKNIGLAASLNKGIRIAKADYIARMDADDIAFPNRLEKQWNYLQAHEDVAVLGTWGCTIDENDLELYNIKNVCAHQDVFVRNIFSSQLIHPSVMIRKSTLSVGNFWYNESFACAQDYELWSRLLLSGLVIENLPCILMKYRLSSNQITSKKRDLQLFYTRQIYQVLIKALFNFHPSSEDIETHLDCCLQGDAYSLWKKSIWLQKLNESFPYDNLKERMREYTLLLLSQQKGFSFIDLLRYQCIFKRFSFYVMCSYIYHKVIR